MLDSQCMPSFGQWPNCPGDRFLQDTLRWPRVDQGDHWSTQQSKHYWLVIVVTLLAGRWTKLHNRIHSAAYVKFVFTHSVFLFKENSNTYPTTSSNIISAEFCTERHREWSGMVSVQQFHSMKPTFLTWNEVFLGIFREIVIFFPFPAKLNAGKIVSLTTNLQKSAVKFNFLVFLALAHKILFFFLYTSCVYLHSNYGLREMGRQSRRTTHCCHHDFILFMNVLFFKWNTLSRRW